MELESRVHREILARRLSEEIEVPSLPSMEAMLQSLGRQAVYGSYRWFSQFIHGTRVGTGTFVGDLGNRDKLVESGSEREWRHCLGWSWYSLTTLGLKVMEVRGVDR